MKKRKNILIPGRLAWILSALCFCSSLSKGSTTSTFDVLVATETLTVVGTTTFQGSAGFVGGSTLTFASGTGLTLDMGANCVGTACRIGYSSGSVNNFSFVLSSGAIYTLRYNVYVVSGSTSTRWPIICRVNNDGYDPAYQHYGYNYPTSYNYNSSSSIYGWPMADCGGGSFAAGDYVWGNWELKALAAGANVLLYNGHRYTTCQGGTPLASGVTMDAGQYSNVNNPAWPWTLKCFVDSTNLTIQHEAVLYQIGK